MGNDNLMIGMQLRTSKYAEKKVRAIASLRKTSMSRLIAIAIDNELEKDKPFEFDLTLPDSDENVEYAYADEGGRMLNFMKSLRVGAGLDILALLRYDIGIPDIKVFLVTFKECLDNDVLESFKPKLKNGMTPYKDDYVYYRIKGYQTPRVKKNRGKDYNAYLKLKKKFEGEE